MGQLTDLESLDTYDGRSRQLKQRIAEVRKELEAEQGWSPLEQPPPPLGDRRGDGQANRAVHQTRDREKRAQPLGWYLTASIGRLP
jgi:hypothetical protein